MKLGVILIDKSIALITNYIVNFFQSFNSFMPNVDIQAGIILLILSIGTMYLLMQVIEKEIIFKWMLISILIVSFFTILDKVKIIDSIAAYTASVEIGVTLLLIITFFISWDEDSIEYT